MGGREGGREDMNLYMSSNAIKCEIMSLHVK